MNSQEPSSGSQALLPAGALVRLRKYRLPPQPNVSASLWAEWKHGGRNKLSFPIGYEVEGILLEPALQGQQILMSRKIRNGVECPGTFRTTKSLKITKSEIVTLNSVYQYTVIQPATL